MNQDIHTEPQQPSKAYLLQRVQRPLIFLTALLSLGMVLLFLIAALHRLSYPFPLEQHEGAMALAVARVTQGLPLYVQPNFSFIPYMYSPAYFYVAGFAAKLFGSGFLSLRLVSLLSTLGCFAVLYALVVTETKNRLAALAGVGLYAAAYPITQNWFDLGRVDSLYVLLVLLALFSTRRLHPVLAALAWTLAVLAKQTIAPVALIVLCFDWKRPRRVLAGVGTFLLTSLGSAAWLNQATHGWFMYYVLTVPQANADLRLHAAAFFLSTALLAPFGVAQIVLAAALFLTDIHWRGERARFYLCAGGSLLALCWFLAAHAQATANTAMPAYAMLAAAFGIAVARLLAWLHGLSSPRARAGEALLLLAVCAQLASQMYSPKLSVPSPAVRTSQQQFVDWLRLFPGAVLVPAHPFEVMLVGKPAHADESALYDALRPGQAAINRPLLQEIQQAIDTESFDAIVLDRAPQEETDAAPWLPADWQTHYPVVGLVPGSDVAHAFFPLPRYVLLPCRALSLAAVQRVRLLSPAMPLAISPATPPPCPESHLR